MQSKEFFEALNALEEQKGIKKEYFIKALEAGLTTAYKKIYNEAKSAVVKLNPEKHTIRIYSYKTVVDEVVDPDKEMSLADARLLKKSYKVGDLVEQEEDSKKFGRIPSQNVRNVIMQKMREAVREKEKQELEQVVGHIMTVKVMRFENDNYYLNMGGMEVEGIMMKNDIIPGERFAPNTSIRAYVKKVVDVEKRGLQLQVSRTSNNFIKELFREQVPEITTGEVEIVSVSRDAGFRAKVAVLSNNQNCDAVGACVGQHGLRIANIINEIHGEKIDIVPYSDNIGEYIANSLSPAEVISVAVDEPNKKALAIVADDKLSLAIGKDGQNVRLAVKLTGWKIDVKSESQAKELGEENILSSNDSDNIEEIEDINVDDLNIDNLELGNIDDITIDLGDDDSSEN